MAAAELEPADRAELLEGLGLGEGALTTMVRATYDAIGLISFYTLGPKEAHAWTVRRGSPAREAAGKIHSDLERGFIRAEVVACDRFFELGSLAEARKSGELKLEGKEYPVQDGDILNIRFSV